MEIKRAERLDESSRRSSHLACDLAWLVILGAFAKTNIHSHQAKHRYRD